MSPEIFKNKPYSYKSDVWALGCVLYEMTTLTHAFDANSLNGLAGKIIKGRYPPIHHKYSKFLRDLISEMLMTNPQQRPDLDQILRKPFIKKHIVNFFVDVMSRPTGSIGEGTMIVRAAVGGSAPMAVNSDSNMLAFKQQLQQLDMMDVVSEALGPKAVPVDYNEAKKLAKEQMGALKREEEHKRMVEVALEKLIQERENKSKERAAGAFALISKQRQQQSQLSQQHQQGIVRKEERPSNIRGIPQPAVYMPRQTPQPSADAGRKEGIRDGGLNWGRKESPGDAAAKVDRDKRLSEDSRRKQQQQQENDAKEKAEEKRREDYRSDARMREDNRLREEAKIREENRLREETAAKQRQDQMRAHADAAAKRDSLRQQERERQLADIEQLKRDKLELDRRGLDSEKVRNERRINEQKRLVDARKEQMEGINDKLNLAADQINRIEPSNRYEEKDISARERVLQRKQDKLAREEQERLDALKEAENANRRVRQQANQQQYSIYTPSSDNNFSGVQYRSGNYDEEPDRRSKGKQNMDMDELTKRLSDAATGKQARYDDITPNNERTTSRTKSNGLYQDDSMISDETVSDDDNDDALWEQQSSNPQDNDEAIRSREEELQAELQMATVRLEELKHTLEVTKTIMGTKQNIAQVEKILDRGVAIPAMISDDEYDEDDDDQYGDTEEFEVVSQIFTIFFELIINILGAITTSISKRITKITATTTTTSNANSSQKYVIETKW